VERRGGRGGHSKTNRIYIGVIMKNLLIIGLMSVISSVLYRLGGIGRPFRSWMRDWIIPLVLVIYMIFRLPVPWYAHLLAFVFTAGALTSYWAYLFKGEDNFYMHGFMIGLSYFPYAIWGGNWLGFSLRCVALAVFMGGLNWFVHKYQIKYSDWIEEFGRGVAIALSLLLLV